MSGGYQIIDLKSLDFVDTSTIHVIDGLYSLIEGTQKTILLHNIVVNSVEYHDVFASVTHDDDHFVLSSNLGFPIYVYSDDSVKYVDSNYITGGY